MITINGKEMFDEMEWELVVKRNDVYHAPHPITRWFRKPLCPICKSKLVRVKACNTLGKEDFALDYHILVCSCGYKFAGGDMVNRIKNTYQYQWLNIETGKNYGDATCQKILDRVNKYGNAKVQIELMGEER